jgi:hypothetical protein
MKIERRKTEQKRVRFTVDEVLDALVAASNVELLIPNDDSSTVTMDPTDDGGIVVTITYASKWAEKLK